MIASLAFIGAVPSSSLPSLSFSTALSLFISISVLVSLSLFPSSQCSVVAVRCLASVGIVRESSCPSSTVSNSWTAVCSHGLLVSSCVRVHVPFAHLLRLQACYRDRPFLFFFRFYFLVDILAGLLFSFFFSNYSPCRSSFRHLSFCP